MRSLLLVVALLLGCGDKDPGEDGVGDPSGGATGSGEDGGGSGEDGGGSGGDAGGEAGGDAGDAGGDDTGSPADDTGSPADDTGSPSEYGQITGDCGELDSSDLSSESPQLLRNAIDFTDVGFDEDWLSAGGQEILEEGNLGGSSIYSEVLAFEILTRCDAASLVFTETEVPYEDEGGKKTDLVVSIDGVEVGVSVTRAYGYPPEDPYTVEQARTLLDDKLADVLVSSDNVQDDFAWPKQILHVVAYADGHADSVEAAWAEVDEAVRADTVVFVTVSDGDDAFLY